LGPVRIRVFTKIGQRNERKLTKEENMLYSKSSLADYFFNSRHALNISQKNAKIYSLISDYNMTTENIAIGLDKLDKLMTADKLKTEARGKQLELRVALETLFAEVHPVYMSHVKLAKVKVQRVPERVARLMLLEPRKTRINDWLRQADTFYTNLLLDTEMVAQFETNAITVEKLNASNMRIKEVEQAYNAYNEAKGIAQEALEARDVLLEDFDAWMKEFIVICKIALRKYPQLLEALGIVVLSKGYVRSKADEAPQDQAVKVRTKLPELKEKSATGSNAEETGAKTQAIAENVSQGADQSDPEVQQAVET
jgi:hypothetical protein